MNCIYCNFECWEVSRVEQLLFNVFYIVVQPRKLYEYLKHTAPFLPKGLDSVHTPTICQLINLIVICAVYYQSILNWTGANINSILLLIFLKACFLINRLQTKGGDYQFTYIFTNNLYIFFQQIWDLRWHLQERRRWPCSRAWRKIIGSPWGVWLHRLQRKAILHEICSWCQWIPTKDQWWPHEVQR